MIGLGSDKNRAKLDNKTRNGMGNRTGNGTRNRVENETKNGTGNGNGNRTENGTEIEMGNRTESRMGEGTRKRTGNVFFNGKPVCDDHWNFFSADIVCKELNFTGALNATSRSCARGFFLGRCQLHWPGEQSWRLSFF